MLVVDKGGGGWFASWKKSDVSVYEDENSCGKVLYKWGEGVALDGFIE